ncbi:unnamed protein product [Rotaria socialis]|uniref:SUEL-type lectin domain-containing protein n=1 Tax=Rotaria socialis TaxID=392032 RepID=A0A817N532_9BILA|nr:unnamed protein product [Rotaria socialis]CAF3250528.1 unnamed protein product [Rotaria socialis]CAF3346699.1 unnamed protein product [Rotaria socialis]CAF3382161.1 unnamed protein product [Rotaria socialis]CAF3751971.1 unnamed protein product [Rotaria socialis]
MITNRVLFSLLFLIIPLILPSWTYKFETCCANEKASNTTASVRLLSCPLNFVIKLRTVIFYTGSGCAPSACQRRLNKHYLGCNNHRTCSISIRCIPMDSSSCTSLTTSTTYAQHLIVDYDCILHEPELSSNSFNRYNNEKIDNTRQDNNENVVVFSAKINIESPPDLLNETDPIVPDILDDDRAWKEFILKQYLDGKRLPLINGEKPIIIQQERSLFNEILRTVIILIVFTLIITVLILIGFFLHKRIKFLRKQKFFGHHEKQKQKHERFPSDEAYDNLKTSAAESTAESAAATDV